MVYYWAEVLWIFHVPRSILLDKFNNIKHVKQHKLQAKAENSVFQWYKRRTGDNKEFSKLYLQHYTYKWKSSGCKTNNLLHNGWRRTMRKNGKSSRTTIVQSKVKSICGFGESWHRVGKSGSHTAHSSQTATLSPQDNEWKNKSYLYLLFSSPTYTKHLTTHVCSVAQLLYTRCMETGSSVG